MNLSNNNKSRNIKILLISIITVILSITIWNGFDQDSALVKRCVVHTEKYVTAEYSDEECSTDMDGILTCDTDYWSKDASDRWTATTVNNELVSTNVNKDEVVKTAYGYYETNTPPHDLSLKKDFDFDNFEKHATRNLTVYINRNGKTDTFSEDPSQNPQCIKKFNHGDNITIKTWYGISYSF
jgi:hypothetical protein